MTEAIVSELDINKDLDGDGKFSPVKSDRGGLVCRLLLDARTGVVIAVVGEGRSVGVGEDERSSRDHPRLQNPGRRWPKYNPLSLIRQVLILQRAEYRYFIRSLCPRERMMQLINVNKKLQTTMKLFVKIARSRYKT